MANEPGYWGFGRTVAISGDTAIVGTDNSGPGAVLLFQRDEGGPGNWGQVAEVRAPVHYSNQNFGVSVSISGDTAVVGESQAEERTGVAWVLQRDEGGPNNWGIAMALRGSGAASGAGRFGNSVAIDGDTILAGAFDDHSADRYAGAAYVFERDAGGADNWVEVRKLYSSAVDREEHFGWGVSLDGDAAVVLGKGAAYHFGRNQGAVTTGATLPG